MAAPPGPTGAEPVAPPLPRPRDAGGGREQAQAHKGLAARTPPLAGLSQPRAASRSRVTRHASEGGSAWSSASGPCGGRRGPRSGNQELGPGEARWRSRSGGGGGTGSGARGEAPGRPTGERQGRGRAETVAGPGSVPDGVCVVGRSQSRKRRRSSGKKSRSPPPREKRSRSPRHAGARIKQVRGWRSRCGVPGGGGERRPLSAWPAGRLLVCLQRIPGRRPGEWSQVGASQPPAQPLGARVPVQALLALCSPQFHRKAGSVVQLPLSLLGVPFGYTGSFSNSNVCDALRPRVLTSSF